MSDLRKAAELAFDALDMYREHDAENIGLADAAYEALRQALARPEWVGLTQEEVDALLWKLSVGAVDEDVRTIEAKLKEKNT